MCAITYNGNSDTGYANLCLLPWNSAPFDGVTWPVSNGMIVLDQLGEGPPMALDAGSSAYPGAPVAADATVLCDVVDDASAVLLQCTTTSTN